MKKMVKENKLVIIDTHSNSISVDDVDIKK